MAIYWLLANAVICPTVYCLIIILSRDVTLRHKRVPFAGCTGYSIPINYSMSLKPLTDRNFIMLSTSKSFNLASGIKYSSRCLLQ